MQIDFYSEVIYNRFLRLQMGANILDNTSEILLQLWND